MRAQACDLTDADQVGRLIGDTVSAWGQVDILVNNAGVSWASAIEDMPVDRWRQVLETNIGGAFLAIRAVLPAMKARGYGKIINIASVMGLVGLPAAMLDAPGYSASKARCADQLTRDLAVKYAPFGVRVNAIAPGFFQTRLTEGVLARAGAAIVNATPLGSIGEPSDLTGTAVFRRPGVGLHDGTGACRRRRLLAAA